MHLVQLSTDMVDTHGETGSEGVLLMFGAIQRLSFCRLRSPPSPAYGEVLASCSPASFLRRFSKHDGLSLPPSQNALCNGHQMRLACDEIPPAWSLLRARSGPNERNECDLDNYTTPKIQPPGKPSYRPDLVSLDHLFSCARPWPNAARRVEELSFHD